MFGALVSKFKDCILSSYIIMQRSGCWDKSVSLATNYTIVNKMYYVFDWIPALYFVYIVTYLILLNASFCHVINLLFGTPIALKFKVIRVTNSFFFTSHIYYGNLMSFLYYFEMFAPWYIPLQNMECTVDLKNVQNKQASILKNWWVWNRL